MPATFATAPNDWTVTSSIPADNISSPPSANNRKLVDCHVAEDLEAWVITQNDIGGQSPSKVHTPVDTSQSTQESRIRQFEFLESKIAAFSGVLRSYADTLFINPIGTCHYYVESALQQVADSYEATIITTDTTQQIVIGGVSAAPGDLAVLTVVSSDASWDLDLVSGLDGFTLQKEYDLNSNFYMAILSRGDLDLEGGNVTLAFDTIQSVRAAAQLVVHRQIPDAGGGPQALARGVGRGIGRGIM